MCLGWFVCVCVCALKPTSSSSILTSDRISLHRSWILSLSLSATAFFFIPAFDTSLQTYLFQTSIDSFISFDVLGLVCVVVCVCVAGGVWVWRRGGLGHWHEGTQCISWSRIPVSTLCVWMCVVCSCVTVCVWVLFVSCDCELWLCVCSVCVQCLCECCLSGACVCESWLCVCVCIMLRAKVCGCVYVHCISVLFIWFIFSYFLEET